MTRPLVILHAGAIRIRVAATSQAVGIYSATVRSMARKVETLVTLTDDLDGGKADRTVSFAFEGANYEIDLSKKNAAAFEKALAPYVGAARKAPRATRARTSASGSRSHGRTDLAEIRAWAKANGYAVSERGRIAQATLDAYAAAAR